MADQKILIINRLNTTPTAPSSNIDALLLVFLMDSCGIIVKDFTRALLRKYVVKVKIMKPEGNGLLQKPAYTINTNGVAL